jgi:hypothetical protein
MAPASKYRGPACRRIRAAAAKWTRPPHHCNRAMREHKAARDDPLRSPRLPQGAIGFDIALQRRHIGFIDVEELHADMENILGQTLRMDDSGRGIQGQAVLHRGLQVKTDFDQDTHDLSGNPLISRQDMMGRVATAAEFDAADRQVDYHRGQVFALRQTHCARDVSVKPKVLSFVPVHVWLLRISC